MSWLEAIEDDLEKVSHHYGVDLQIFNKDAEIIKNWLATQNDFPEVMESRKIISFLILNKCDVEKTKEKIEWYYKIRRKIPDMFVNSNPKSERMQRIMNIVYCVPMPKLTKEMSRVTIVKLRRPELVGSLELHDLLIHILNIGEMRLYEDVALQEVHLWDLQGLNMQFAIKLSPRLIRNVVTICQKVFSLRIKSVYLVNCLSIFTFFVNIAKRLMKEKLGSRIFVSADARYIKNLPVEILPKDYDGRERSLEELNEVLKLKFIEYQKRFDKLDEL